jgi:hypothetical protein
MEACQSLCNAQEAVIRSKELNLECGIEPASFRDPNQLLRDRCIEKSETCNRSIISW